MKQVIKEKRYINYQKLSICKDFSLSNLLFQLVYDKGQYADSISIKAW